MAGAGPQARPPAKRPASMQLACCARSNTGRTTRPAARRVQFAFAAMRTAPLGPLHASRGRRCWRRADRTCAAPIAANSAREMEPLPSVSGFGRSRRSARSPSAPFAALRTLGRGNHAIVVRIHAIEHRDRPREEFIARDVAIVVGVRAALHAAVAAAAPAVMVAAFARLRRAPARRRCSRPCAQTLRRGPRRIPGASPRRHCWRPRRTACRRVGHPLPEPSPVRRRRRSAPPGRTAIKSLRI